MKLPFWANLNTLAAAIIVALLFYIGVQKIELLSCKLQSEKRKSQLEKMSDAKNEQKVRTERIIVEVEKRSRDADTIAKRIEAAPLPGQCRTPDEVLKAGL